MKLKKKKKKKKKSMFGKSCQKVFSLRKIEYLVSNYQNHGLRCKLLKKKTKEFFVLKKEKRIHTCGFTFFLIIIIIIMNEFMLIINDF